MGTPRSRLLTQPLRPPVAGNDDDVGRPSETGLQDAVQHVGRRVTKTWAARLLEVPAFGRPGEANVFEAPEGTSCYGCVHCTAAY